MLSSVMSDDLPKIALLIRLCLHVKHSDVMLCTNASVCRVHMP